MKPKSLALVALVLPALFAGCNTADNLALQSFAIAYVVESTGAAATVSQINYTDTSGNLVTVMTPTLPFTISASRSEGDTAQLIVMGTTGATSTITATIQDDPLLVMTPGTYQTSTCAENTNPCTIDLTHTF